MKKFTCLFFLLIAFLGSAQPCLAAEPAKKPKSGAVSTGAYGGEGQELGLLDGMIPLKRREGWMLLLNPRFSGSDGEGFWGSLRLIERYRTTKSGMRTLYLSGELRQTPTDHYFSTFALGGEHRGPRFTQRLRGYVSPHDANLAERREVKETFTNDDGGTTTILSYFEKYEIPLSGAETEFGSKIPLPTSIGELRAFLGYYFRDGPKTDAEDGWMTRVEFRPRNFLALEFITYHDRDFSGSKMFWGARFIFPFGPADSADPDAMWFEPLPHSPIGDTLAKTVKENKALRTTSTTPPPRRRRSPAVSPPSPPPPSPPPIEEEEECVECYEPCIECGDEWYGDDDWYDDDCIECDQVF